jgi:uncharacterized protein (DUF3084 family)
MRDVSFLRSPALLVVLATAQAPALATAQENDTELLRAIVCEIRELRSVVSQGQILVPLLEANQREREDASQQLVKVEAELRLARLAAQGSRAEHGKLSTELRTLTRTGRLELDRADFEARKKSLENDLASAERTAQHYQAEEGRLFSAAGQIKTRVSRLEDEFDRMQRQMQAMATTGNSVCESDSPER